MNYISILTGVGPTDIALGYLVVAASTVVPILLLFGFVVLLLLLELATGSAVELL